MLCVYYVIIILSVTSATKTIRRASLLVSFFYQSRSEVINRTHAAYHTHIFKTYILIVYGDLGICVARRVCHWLSGLSKDLRNRKIERKPLPISPSRSPAFRYCNNNSMILLRRQERTAMRPSREGDGLRNRTRGAYTYTWISITITLPFRIYPRPLNTSVSLNLPARDVLISIVMRNIREIVEIQIRTYFAKRNVSHKIISTLCFAPRKPTHTHARTYHCVHAPTTTILCAVVAVVIRLRLRVYIIFIFTS